MNHNHTIIFPESVAIEKFKDAPTHPWTTEVISSSIIDSEKIGQNESRLMFHEAQENIFKRSQQDRLFNDNQVDFFYLVGRLLMDNLPTIFPETGKSVEVTISWEDDAIQVLKFEFKLV